MDRQRRPQIGTAIPFLFGDQICRLLDAAVPELDIAAGIFVLLDLELAVRADLKQFDAGIAELVGGKERAVRLSERDPGNGGLGLQLRQEHELAPLRVVDIEHFLRNQRAHRDRGGSRLRRDRLQLIADRGDDLVVDGVGKGLADLGRGAPPQQMHADRADDDGHQHEAGDGAANSDTHSTILAAGWLTHNTDGIQPRYA